MFASLSCFCSSRSLLILFEKQTHRDWQRASDEDLLPMCPPHREGLHFHDTRRSPSVVVFCGGRGASRGKKLSRDFRGSKDGILSYDLKPECTMIVSQVRMWAQCAYNVGICVG